MKLPLVILATDDRSIELCTSIDYLGTIMEPSDVETGLYRVFDADGIEYPVYINIERRLVSFLFGLIRVHEKRPTVTIDFDKGHNAVDAFFGALAYYLTNYLNFEEGDCELPLEELIHLIDQFQRANR